MKVSVIGNALVITSDLSLEDINLVKKYSPKSLILMGGEDGKDPLFAIGVGESGGINDYGATFTGATRDDKKLATLTMGIRYDGDDVKEFIADEFGGALMNLEKIEAAIPGVVKEIKAQKESVMKGITVE